MSAQPQLMTEAEYLSMERASPIKHEFYQGRIYAMTGASETHNLICMNVAAALHTQLRRKACRVYANDMRVAIPSTKLYTYPDIVIVCGQPLFNDEEQDTLLNPKVIIEVLSPSTERYDRGMKFQHYSRLETISDYLLVSQNQRRIEHFVRQKTGQWLLDAITSPEQLVVIESVECSLNLDDVYEKVSLPESHEGVTRDMPQDSSQ